MVSLAPLASVPSTAPVVEAVLRTLSGPPPVLTVGAVAALAPRVPLIRSRTTAPAPAGAVRARGRGRRRGAVPRGGGGGSRTGLPPPGGPGVGAGVQGGCGGFGSVPGGDRRWSGVSNPCAIRGGPRHVCPVPTGLRRVGANQRRPRPHRRQGPDDRRCGTGPAGNG